MQKIVIIKLSQWLYAVTYDWQHIPALIIFLIIPVSIIYILKKIGGFRFRDFDILNSYSNPPTWYAALIVICLYPIVAYHYNGGSLDRWQYGFIGFVLLVFLIVTITCMLIRFLLRLVALIIMFVRLLISKYSTKHMSKAVTKKDGLKELTENPEKLIEWLQKEEPINSCNEDYFNATPIANRIADRLLKDPPETISFIGNYGSGKTSVLNLAGIRLEQNGVLVLSLSAWAFEDGKFINYVITHIINKIAQKTDCISVSLLPFQFQNTFQQLDLGIFNFIKLFIHTESPEELVKKINDILVRAGNKITVFIEDIDRNKSPDDIGQEIYSSFNYFSAQKNVSFVITCGGII